MKIDSQGVVLPPGVELYLDLMKKALTFYVWGEPLREYTPPKGNTLRAVVLRTLVRKLATAGKKIYFKPPYDPTTRIEGRDHPLFAHTMIGLRRLDNIQDCVLAVLRDNVPGDLIEAGVWRGGAVIFMKAVLHALGDESRKVWVADSFQGLMEPHPERYPADQGSVFHNIPYLAVGEDEVRENFNVYGLLDDNVKFLKGWFKDSLPNAPLENLAVLRLDGDMYESTMDVLTSLYPKVSVGGYVIVDDFGDLQPCRKAVEDYRARNNISEQVQWADWSCIYWRKQRQP